MKLFDSLVPVAFRPSVRGPLLRFYGCTFVACFGAGLTLALFVIYLHNVRGFSTSFATLLLTMSALIGLGTAPLWGTLTDRIGPVPVILVGYSADAVAIVLWAFAHTRLQATLATVLLAIFGGAGGGPGGTLLARLAPPEHRQWAFGFNFMMVNLGIGFGGLISATIVNLAHPGTFVTLYVVNAAVQLVAALLATTLRGHGHATEELDERQRAEGWRVVVKDRLLLRYVTATLVMMIGGYGSVDAGLSLFIVNNLHVSVHAIGVIYFFNTSTIVFAQIAVLHRIEGRSRTRVLSVVGVLWFAFWIILEVALALPALVAIGSICLAMIVFAIGETMIQPVGSAIVNHIAPEHLRGRYNAAAGAAFGISATIAPALTGLYYSVHLGNWWPLGTGVTALAGGAMMLNLRHHLTGAADGRAEVASA